nr:MAC/perforin [Theileria orientalis]
MNISYLLVCVTLFSKICKQSYSLTISSHLGAENGYIDSEEDDLEELNPEHVLLDQDIEEMLSNNSNDEYDRGCPGLDYLGVGYDSIYANSMGGDASILDPGYRAPIIEFTWRKNSEGFSPTLGSLHPVGGWVRPVFSCSRSTKINEISNLDDLKDSLSANAKLNGDIPNNSFTGSLEYKNSFSKFKSKSQRVYNKIEQCIRYQVGIPLNLPWKFTESFEFSVSKLPVLKYSEIKGCNILDKSSGSNEKCDPIKPWIKFFEMFGTHFNHQLTLGGKITQTMRFDASKLKDLREHGVDVDIAIQTSLGSSEGNLSASASKDKSKLDEIGFKKISVLGGHMPNFPLDDEEFASWAESVSENPMPIGVVATSLKTLLDPKLHSSYDEALHQYGILNGINYEQLKVISGDVTEFSKEIENSTNIVSLSRENKFKCPEGSKILSGVSLIFGENKLLGVNYCESKVNECMIPTYDDVKYSWNWISCTSGLQPGVEQFVKISEDNETFVELKCPEHSTIQMGLIVVTNNGEITAMNGCEYGKKSCLYHLKGEETAYIWGVCYSYHEKLNKLQLKFSTPESPDEDKLSCSEGYKIITGFMTKLPKKDSSKFDDPEACDKYGTSCKFKDSNNPFGFILCKS